MASPKTKSGLGLLTQETIFKRLAVTRDIRPSMRGETASEAIGTLSHGCEVYGFTKGQFSLINVLEHCLSETGPADVVICTWSAASGDIRAANRLLSNHQIKTLKFIVDFSFQRRKPEFCAELTRAFGVESTRVTSIHAKFCMVRNAAWNLVIRTSMNLNYNPRFENFEISDDPRMADFLAGVVADIWATQEPMQGFVNRPIDNVREFSRMYTTDEMERTSDDALTGGEL